MQNLYAVNARFVTQPLTGVQRYCHEVGRRLVRGALLTPRPPLPEYGGLESRLQVTGGCLTGHAWEQVSLPSVVGSGLPLLSPAGCGPVAYADQVLVVHDVAVLENPEWYGRRYAALYRRLLPVLLRRVRRVLTVSEFCRDRVLRLLALPEKKVEVVFEAAARHFFPRSDGEIQEALSRRGLPEVYFLAIGAVSERKNLGRLVSVWEQIQPEFGDARLVVVGRERLSFSRHSRLQKSSPGVAYVSALTDEELARVYSGARGLLYPSLYEGFGLPILEAMACGCPVLTSGCTAMPEVAGDAAVLVDPLSEASIAAGIRSLWDRGAANRLRANGLRRSKDFSWSRTVAKVEAALLN